MLQGVLIDEAIEVLFQRARDFRRSPRVRAIDQALDPLAGKTMDPLAESGRGDGRQRRVADSGPCTTLRTAWARRKT